MSKVDEEDSPFPLNDIDRFNLSQTNDQFYPHTWDEVREIIAENNLSILKRWPSDLRRYMKWSTNIKAKYGTVPNYIMHERLKWTPISWSSQTGPVFECKSTVPLQHPDDFKVMPNDWPYGLAAGITHLIVWLKIRLETEPLMGKMTPEARSLVEEFVDKRFVKPTEDLPGHKDKVQWFKNWVALQSIPGIEHFHVLVRDVPEDLVLKWTAGERMKQE